MKEKKIKDKPDIKNKYYELGWFSTKIKEVDIDSLKDICDWIDAMRELAEKGWKRQLWGAKKKDDRGMLGILKVCKDNNFDKLKDLPHGIFDCVNLKNLLDEINKCVGKTSRGRTKQPGFSKTLDNCNKYLNNLIENIREAANALQCSNLHTEFDENSTLFDLGRIIYIHDNNSPLKEIEYTEYQKAITKVQAFFENIEKNKQMELDTYYDRPEIANSSIINYLGKINKYSHYWINEKIVDSSKALEIKSNIAQILEYLKKGKITFIKKGKKE